MAGTVSSGVDSIGAPVESREVQALVVAKSDRWMHGYRHFPQPRPNLASRSVSNLPLLYNTAGARTTIRCSDEKGTRKGCALVFRAFTRKWSVGNHARNKTDMMRQFSSSGEIHVLRDP
jgi:hypothetical protein